LVARVIAKLEPGGAQLSMLRVRRELRGHGIASALYCGWATPAGIELARRHGAEPDIWGDGGNLQWVPEPALRRVAWPQGRRRRPRPRPHVPTAERFRSASMSVDDVFEFRELTALADELANLALRPGIRTVVLRPARLSAYRDAVARFVETRDEAAWIGEADREPLARLRGLLVPLEELTLRRSAARRALASAAPLLTWAPSVAAAECPAGARHAGASTRHLNRVPATGEFDTACGHAVVAARAARPAPHRSEREPRPRACGVRCGGTTGKEEPWASRSETASSSSPNPRNDRPTPGP
jgi:hypothetical protein